MSGSMEAIAVVGMAARFPGAADLEQLWTKLSTGTETPLSTAVDGVDADLFGFAAEDRDPEVMLFVEAAHAAIEHAGYAASGAGDDCGLYAAVGPTAGSRPGAGVIEMTCGALDLRGPAVSITSGSLVALHLACQALRLGECDAAVAGGAHVTRARGDGRTAGGRGRPFDVAAAGLVPGDGAGVVLLKRLADALADGDQVHTIIRGTAISSGTDPDSRAVAIVEAMTGAGFTAQDMSWVEATGTATTREDLAEILALTMAYRHLSPDLAAGSIPVGAVSANLGRPGQAAGVGGLIKMALAFGHEELPAQPNFTAPHPRLALGETPFFISQAPRPWPARAGRPRRAGLNAFGVEGTHTHVVLEEGPRPAYTPSDGRPRLIVWSGRNQAAADATRRRLADYFARADEQGFIDAVATLQHGRDAHPVRGTALSSDAAQAAAALRGEPAALTAGAVVLTGSGGRDQPPVVFGFAEHVAPPADLYGREPTVTETLDRCFELFERHDIDAHGRWLAGDVTAETMFCAQYALAETLLGWGIRPARLIGRGVGAITAHAITADLAEAVRLIARGTTPSRDHPPGSPRDGELVLEIGGEHPLETLARLWLGGVDVDWAIVDDEPFQRLPVPGYAYQRERFSPDAVVEAGPAAGDLGTGQTSVDQRPAPEPADPPLGLVQHAFWILEQLSPDSGTSNIAVAYRTATPLRWWPLHEAANHLVRRHPALRQRFPDAEGAPVRRLVAADAAKLTVDVATAAEDDLDAALRAYIRRPFDIANDLLLRVGHFTLPTGQSVLCLVAHHIVADGASCELLMEELGRCYDGMADGGEIPADLRDEAPMLATAPPPADAMDYWLERLRDVDPEAMTLPGARPVPANPTFEGQTISSYLSADAVAAMRRLGTRLNVTDNIILLSAFALTLLRHGAGPDLVVGVPVGTRLPAQRTQVGYGVSTLALRVTADPAAGFADLVHRVRDAFLDGAEHAAASIEAVVPDLGHRGGHWRAPVFRHLYNYRPWREDRIRIGGATPEPVPLTSDRSRLDIEYVIVPQGERVWVRATYGTEVHDEAEISAFVQRFDLLLRGAAADPHQAVAELELMSEPDRALWESVNATRRDPGPATVLERIVAHAAASPAAIAVVDGDEVMTYGELIATAAAVRARLAATGVAADDVVAVTLGRGTDLAAAVLGVWAAGAAYLPLDPRQPDLRLADQIGDSGARLVLGPAADAPPWAGECPVIAMDAAVPPAGAGLAAPDPDSAAYVIYTSGSTGRPKGVAVSHRNLANLIGDFAERLSTGASTAVAWSTTFTFDISALELFLPLCSGGRVIVVRDEAQTRPRAFLDLVEAHDVSIVQATPTVWRLIAGEIGDELTGRAALCGGEPLPEPLARRLLTRAGRLINVYGPTETTIWSTAAELTAADPVTIGRPLANTQVFVTGPAGEELPPGLPGELCIAGTGVSLGYVGRPELTERRFGVHPAFGRFYRTGDLARLGYDGNLVMLGRDDRQVKLRGHRVELGEVEAVLQEHSDVAAAATVISGDPQGDGRLLAFVLPAVRRARDLAEEVWRHARARLPDYAVPSGVMLIAEIPLTPSGKTDYGALLDLEQPGSKASPIDRSAADAPIADELIGRLVRLWRETLGRTQLGSDDNFFLNGGHSLLAVTLIPHLQEITGRTVPIRLVFDHPTPAALAAHLRQEASR